MATLIKYKTERTLKERKLESQYVIENNPLRIPVIIECDSTDEVHHLKKRKFLMEKEKATVDLLLHQIHKRLTKDAQKMTINLRFNNSVANPDDLLSKVYDKHMDEDGFLYATYCLEKPATLWSDFPFFDTGLAAYLQTFSQII